MERFFIIVVKKLGVNDSPSLLVKEFTLMRNYQQLFLKSLKNMNSASQFLPLNPSSIEWAVCIEQERIVVRGTGPEEYQGLISCTFTADLPSEPWDNHCFSQFKNKAVDIFIALDNCPSFWNSFDSSNRMKIHQLEKNFTFNPQLFWRGTLKMSNPQAPANFGHLENAEISYCYDELDLLLSSHNKGEVSNLLPIDSFQKQERKILSPFIELVGAFYAHTIPVIFYSSTSFFLTVDAAETFWNTLNESVSLLFRLDYTPEGTDNQSMDLVGTQCVYLLSHWNSRQLKMFVLKNADELQNLANVFTSSATIVPVHNVTDPICSSPALLRLDDVEVKTRRLQLIALQAWIEENGSPDRPTLDALLSEISLSVLKNHQPYVTCDTFLPTSKLHCPEYSEGGLLKWKLREIEKKNDINCQNRLLQSSGRVIKVDIPHFLRCFGRHKFSVIGSPSNNTTNIRVQSRLKPTCDMETARRSTNWPHCTLLKYHGINYNLSADDERTAKQETEYQNKWVSSEAESASWCNPWAINSSSTYQLTNARKTRIQQLALLPQARTPRKQTSDSSQLRKSPRLLAKNTRPITRRTPSKKNNTRAVSGTETILNTEKDFKQQLKAVIIRVLADKKISTQDPLFRTCANKLSVICMALLKDSKAVVTPRQMYQVAKSQAKQVLQFVKP